MVASSTLRRIPVALENNPYEVVIGAGGLSGIGAELKQAGIRAGRRILVVSNADVGHTYKYLIDSKHRRKWTDRKVEKMSYTMSCFLLYIGVKKRYPDLEHHT